VNLLRDCHEQEAFKNLSNLETVGMRDFNSATRHRDYPSNEWRSYGWETFQQETGTRLNRPGGFPRYGGGTSMSWDQSIYDIRVFLNILRTLPYFLKNIPFSHGSEEIGRIKDMFNAISLVLLASSINSFYPEYAVK